MVLMDNKYLNFDNIYIEELGTLRNFTSINLLPEIPDKYFTESYVIKKIIVDNSFIEGIAFDIWQTTDHWDTLMMLNKMDSLESLPVDNDEILIRANKELEKWKKINKTMKNSLSEEEITNKLSEFVKSEFDKNETFRIINYIYGSDLSELEADLEIKSASPKINANIIAY